MRLKHVKNVMCGLLAAMTLSLVVALVLVSAGAFWTGFFFVALGTVLFFVFMAYSFARWRCPHCGEFLGWNLGKGIPFCPFCVDRLDK